MRFREIPLSLLLFFSLLATSSAALSDQKQTQSSNRAIMQTVNQTLYGRLPEQIKSKDEIVIVNDGTFPPYVIYNEDNSLTGASIDLANALGELLGIKVIHDRVGGLPAVLSGIQSQRYDFAIGPFGDTPARQENGDFIDYVKEYPALAVLTGNPLNIQEFDDVCGRRVSVLAGGNAEKRAINKSELCVKEGKDAIDIMAFREQPAALLAVQSGKADAFMSSAASIAYYVEVAKGKVEPVAVGLKPSSPYPQVIMGAIVSKGSPLGAVIRDAMQELFDNGTYQAIMKKWGLEGSMLSAPGINLATKDI